MPLSHLFSLETLIPSYDTQKTAVVDNPMWAKQQVAIKNERILALAFSLHISLDIRAIINHFFQGLKQELSLERMRYAHKDLGISITHGTTGNHLISYRLTLAGSYLGKLQFSRNYPFENEEITLLENLLTLLLHPLRNAIQYYHAVKHALHDPLTGVCNRTALESALKRDLDLAKRHKMPFSLLILDIDHFKAINDTYGHAAGDEYLKRFAKQIELCTRESDMVFRTGGEEFVILLSKTNQDGALLLAERIRQAIASLTCEYQDQAISTTVSIGTTTLDLTGQDNIETLLERADQAMYQAKQDGRNQICVANSTCQ
ncbi:MAG: GGDEF domain-containing protein [Gammaproteobacteria bacterium]